MSSIRLNLAKERLANGKPITIMVVTMPSVAAAQLWARAGIDVLIFDMEHGVIGIESLHAMIAATAGTETIPMARVPWNVHWLVKPVLDAGALGIMFPLVATAADAEAAVRSMYYPPKGDRGWGPFMTQHRWGLSHAGYVEIANQEMLTFIQIERPEAVDNLESIVKVPGIDMFVVSRHDLTTSMGRIASPTQELHPDVQRSVDRIEQVIRASGVPMGGLARSVEHAKVALERGYLGLILGFDWMLMERAAEPAREIKQQLLR
jgi:4-hydroxy-2-oxoheptanedioate aldolase